MEGLGLALLAHDVVVDEAGRLKVIDTIGSACTLVVTSKAGYAPKNARLHRFFELLEGRLPGLHEGRPIVWFDQGVPGWRFVLPAAAERFYRGLPPGVARLGWLAAARRQMEARQAKPAHELLHVQEHRELGRVARQRGLNLLEASICQRLPSGGLSVHVTGEGQPRIFPLAEVGLLFNRWGFAQPDFPPRPLPPDQPVCNHPLVDFALERAKWAFRTLATRKRPELAHLFPRETYVGMAGAGPDDVATFADALTPAEGMPAAVLKPLATHAGLDVNFLDKEDLERLTGELAATAHLHAGVRDAVREAHRQPFPYTAGDLMNGAFVWDVAEGLSPEQWRDLRLALLEFSGEDRRRWLEAAFPGQEVLLRMHQWPLVETASYILQEFVTARPVVSVRAGEPRRGYLRALFLGSQLVAIVYRFARQERPGFTNLADPAVPTFFEPAPTEVEERLEAELGALNAAFLAALAPYASKPDGALRLSRDMLAANWERVDRL